MLSDERLKEIEGWVDNWVETRYGGTDRLALFDLLAEVKALRKVVAAAEQVGHTPREDCPYCIALDEWEGTEDEE